MSMKLLFCGQCNTGGAQIFAEHSAATR